MSVFVGGSRTEVRSRSSVSRQNQTCHGRRGKGSGAAEGAWAPASPSSPPVQGPALLAPSGLSRSFQARSLLPNPPCSPNQPMLFPKVFLSSTAAPHIEALPEPPAPHRTRCSPCTVLPRPPPLTVQTHPCYLLFVSMPAPLNLAGAGRLAPGPTLSPPMGLARQRSLTLRLALPRAAPCPPGGRQCPCQNAPPAAAVAHMLRRPHPAVRPNSASARPADERALLVGEQSGAT